MAQLASMVNTGVASITDAIDELSAEDKKRDKVIVDLLKALGETHPELLIKHMDYIAGVENESKK